VLICIRHQIPALQHRSISIPSSALYNGTRIRPTRWRAHLWLPRLEHHVERCICINHRRTTERTGDGAEMWTIDEAELAIWAWNIGRDRATTAVPCWADFHGNGLPCIISTGVVKENMVIVLLGGARVEFTPGETRRWIMEGLGMITWMMYSLIICFDC